MSPGFRNGTWLTERSCTDELDSESPQSRIRNVSDGCPKTNGRGGRYWAATCVVGRERATGIEPAFSAWEADVLPLNYARERPPHYPLTPLVKSQVALALRPWRSSP